MTDLNTPTSGQFLGQVHNMLTASGWRLDAESPHRAALTCALDVLNRLNHRVPDQALGAFVRAIGELAREEVAESDGQVACAEATIRLFRAVIARADDELTEQQVSDLTHGILAVQAVVLRRIALAQHDGAEPAAGSAVAVPEASATASARAEAFVSRNYIPSRGLHLTAFAHGFDALDALEAPVPDAFFDAFASAARRVAEAERAGVPGVDGAAAERAVLVGFRLDCESEESRGLDEARALELSQMTLAMAILIVHRIARENAATA